MVVSFDRYQTTTVWLARASSLLFFYGVVASMAAANIGMALTLFFWTISGVWIRKSPSVLKSPVTLPIVALVLVTLLSLSYTVAPLDYVGRYFLVYGKWLFVLVLINLHTDSKWLKPVFGVVGFAVGVVLLSTYANVFLDVPWANSPGGFGVDNSVFYDYIAQGVMTCCVSVVAWVLTFRAEEKKIRWVSGLVFVLLAFSLFFLLTSRTGQLAMAVSLFVVSTLMFSKRQFLVFLLMLVFAAVALLEFSPVLVSKIQLVVKEALGYFKQGAEITSVGARISMWINSIHFIADAPLFGHGVGGYRYLSEKVYTDPIMCAISCVHPHNQPLFLMVEYGVVGLCVYGLFVRAFLLAARDLHSMKSPVYLVVMGVLAVFFVDSMINSPLWISSLRNFYIAAFALIFIHHALARKEV